MRGYRNFNFPAFDEVARALRHAGHEVFNPAQHDCEVYPNIREWPGFASGDTTLCPEFNLPMSLRWDFARIMDADAIAMLPGWTRSSGAKAERFIAEAVGLPVYDVMLYNDGHVRLALDAEQQRMGYPTLKEQVWTRKTA